MTRPINLGTWFGLKTTISPLSIVSHLAVIPVAAVAAGVWLSLSLGGALWAGILSSLTLLVSAWLHQRGHALAAKRVGYPMIGVHFHSLLSAGLYPADEPPLPPRTHILRALGGFWVNLLIGLVLTPAMINLWPAGGVIAWVTAVAVVWNFFVLGLGAFLPLDLPQITTDGGTILRYWREGRNGKRQM